MVACRNTLGTQHRWRFLLFGISKDSRLAWIFFKNGQGNTLTSSHHKVNVVLRLIWTFFDTSLWFWKIFFCVSSVYAVIFYLLMCIDLFCLIVFIFNFIYCKKYVQVLISHQYYNKTWYSGSFLKRIFWCFNVELTHQSSN